MYSNRIEDKSRILINKIMTDRRVQSLMEKLWMYDSTSFTHSMNVAYLTAHECYILEYNKKDRYIYTSAALLHDVGKTKIDAALLNKTDVLSQAEFETIKMHSIYSGEILREAGFEEEIINIVVHHHEKPDGTGYPDGLTEDKIPQGSKLISTIDAYDAMTAQRPYGKQKSKTQAITTLQYEKNFNKEYIEHLKHIDL